MKELIVSITKLYKYNQIDEIGKKIHAYTKYHALELSTENLADLIDDNNDSLTVEEKLVDVLFLFGIEFNSKFIDWNFTVG